LKYTVNRKKISRTLQFPLAVCALREYARQHPGSDAGDRKEALQMKLNARFAIRVLQALAVGTALASTASAGCGDVSSLQPPFQFAQALAAPLALHAMSASSNAMFNTASPIGMWNVQLISLGNGSHNPPIPDGALIDFGYTQWHSDGTEILNSGAHAPATENFCLGVWVRTGMFTYELNHFALSYDATSGALANKVNIREQITLDPSGNQYSGTFTIDIYDPTSGQHLDHLAGTVAATRVTVDQTTP
jgi:hypothetical protein